MKSPVPLVLTLLFTMSQALAQSGTPPTQSDTGANKNSTTARQNAAASQNAPAGQSTPGVSSPATKPELDPLNSPGDPLLDVPPVPKGKTTLVGGNVTKIDTIRNRMQVQPFGDKNSMKVSFDERTRVFRDGRETTQASIHKGDRVYLDTMLDGPRVFARNIRVVNLNAPSFDTTGQIVGYEANRSRMDVVDQVTHSSFSFTLSPQTVIKLRDGRAGTAADLRPQALVAVHFAPGGERRGTAREVEVLALPGDNFIFAGKLTFVDLRGSLIALENESDSKIYDLNFDPHMAERERLRVGTDVTVTATFTGKGYQAEKIEVR